MSIPSSSTKIQNLSVQGNLNSKSPVNTLIEGANDKNFRNYLANLLTELDAEPTFACREGPLARDIVDYLIPSFLQDPNNFTKTLLKDIDQGDIPSFLDGRNDKEIGFGQGSWKNLLSDKASLKGILKVIDTALKTLARAKSINLDEVPSLKELINKIPNERSEIDPATANRATNSKKLLILGGLTLTGAIGAGVMLTGTDRLPEVVSNNGVTPPPAQTVGNEALKKITNFPGNNLSVTDERALRAMISKNFIKIEAKSKALDFKSYYGGTSKPVSQNGKIIGVLIQVDMKTASGDQPHVLVAQRNNDGIQFALIQVEEAKATPLVQVGKDFTFITMPAGSDPKVEKLPGDLRSLETPAQP
jgi:hypothetical protein